MASGKSGETLRIPGIKKIQERLKEMGAENADFQKASFEAGTISADAVKVQIGLISKSGKLMRSVKVSKIVRKVQITVGSKSKVPYAAAQNYGYRKGNIEGKYFLQMGVRRSRQKMLDTYLDALQDLVDKYERKLKNDQN
jgi:hypothetical protein